MADARAPALPEDVYMAKEVWHKTEFCDCTDKYENTYAAMTDVMEEDDVDESE